MNYEQADMQMPEDQNTPGTEQEDQFDPQTAVNILLEATNLAEKMDEEELNELGQRIKKGFEIDLQSREAWERCVDEWTKLALQYRENKTWPWPKASNVKYPLLSVAAMQFAARAYPSLVPSDGKIVKGKVIGKDPMGDKLEKADRIATYMSYQLMQEMPDWEEDMDKLLMILPIVGICFKKTYFDPSRQTNCSRLVLPKNLVVNYWATSLDEAERVSEIIEMTPRVYNGMVREGIFLDQDLGAPPTPEHEQNNVQEDETVPYIFIECHTYADIDEDGYEEPVIITFHKHSGKILRIVSRYEIEAVEVDEKDRIIKIAPTQYYTKFPFIPNPDGSFYDIGFGVLLGPLNESVNTLINQLIDSGTINNLQSGFLSKNLRIRQGATSFEPGEWKQVAASGEELQRGIFPLPTKEPSNVLFQLMGALVTSGKELASVAEIFTGKMPGQNTPATTTMATVEQGMKVFTAVYKRVFRSLDSEFKKLFRLNHIYLNPQTYESVLDAPIGPQDFDKSDYDVCPAADPAAVSQAEKLMKAQALMEIMQFAGPILNPIKVIARILEAQEQPNWEDLFSDEVQQTGQIPQTPDPKQVEMQRKMELEEGKAQLRAQQQQMEMELKARDAEQQQAMKAQMHQLDMASKLEQAQVDAEIARSKQQIFVLQGAQKLQQQQAEGEIKQQNLKKGSSDKK